MRVEAHPGPARRRPGGHLARRGQKVAAGVLGVDAKLDGVAADGHVVLAQRQALAGGDADAGLDDVDAGHHLGDAVLDLHARVHLHEIEVAGRVEQKLDRAGALVAGGAGGLDGGLAHARPQLGRDGRRGRFFDQLLVAALDGAVALAQVDGVAGAVGERLDLDMARLGDVLLDVHGAVAEGGLSLAAEPGARRRPGRPRRARCGCPCRRPRPKP
jgi:hypothetical protein